MLDYLLTTFVVLSWQHSLLLFCVTIIFRYFTSVRSILQGACHMVALHIACDPLVRQALRQVFSTRAMVNVTPSKKGKKVSV